MLPGGTGKVGTDDPSEIENICLLATQALDNSLFPVQSSATEDISILLQDLINNLISNNAIIKIECAVLSNTENAGIPACKMTHFVIGDRGNTISDFYPIDSTVEWTYPEPPPAPPPPPPAPPEPFETSVLTASTQTDNGIQYGFTGVGYGYDYDGTPIILYNENNQWLGLHSAYTNSNGDFVVELRKQFGDDGTLITDKNYFDNLLVSIETEPGVFLEHTLLVSNSVYSTGETVYSSDNGIWVWSNPGFSLTEADLFKLRFDFTPN